MADPTHLVESRSLAAILRDQSRTIPAFFERVWQVSCGYFPYARKVDSSKSETALDLPSLRENPHQALVDHGFHVLVDLLEATRRDDEEEGRDEADILKPLLFKNLTSLSPQERAIYNGSLFSAYLDGCSVVINHADRLSPCIAALCDDLQLSFPHAYANTYLTPPNSQAVPPHADDRDVLVLQVLGSKTWKVYQKIPVPYPYPHEQVGKAGLDVPEAVTQGEVLIEVVLKPGDVLYMPRGYVHQARATKSEPSFHVTIALATHDWSLGGVLAAAANKIFTSVIELRKAVPREFGRQPWNSVNDADKMALQKQIDQAIDLLRREVTAETVHNSLERKYTHHNQRVKAVRQGLLMSLATKKPSSPARPPRPMPVVGREASERVTLSSVLRVASDREKATLPPPTQPRGLHVREANYNVIMTILQMLKSTPSRQCRVGDLKASLLADINFGPTDYVCNLTLLSFARQCVELGALAIVGE